MPCTNSSLCSTSPTTLLTAPTRNDSASFFITNTTNSTANYPSDNSSSINGDRDSNTTSDVIFFLHNLSSPVTSPSALPTATDDSLEFQDELAAVPEESTIVTILCFSVLVFLCSTLVLLSTRYTSGGRSATLVFLRSLCLSDILMSTYGVFKMTMLLYLDHLDINFFLPESLFFTASLASTMSLLSLNIDCFMKLARPHEYAQVDKDTVITIMLLMWNAAFIVGFLPLLGWNDEEYTIRFFSFYPWHYLLFNGFVIFVCVVVCIVCMVSLKKFYTLPRIDPDCFSTRTLEVRKYQHLHRTIIVESIMWLWCYFPFFLYIALTCPQCLLSDYIYRDSTILYFIPVFLVKSLLSSFLQAFRTFHVHAIMNKLLSDTSLMKHLRDHKREKRHRPKADGVAAISYINPLCEHHNNHHHNSMLRNHRITLNHEQFTLHHNISETDLTELTNISDMSPSLNGSSMTVQGITNYSFLPSLDLSQRLDNVSQETTAL